MISGIEILLSFLILLISYIGIYSFLSFFLPPDFLSPNLCYFVLFFSFCLMIAFLYKCSKKTRKDPSQRLETFSNLCNPHLNQHTQNTQKSAFSYKSMPSASSSHKTNYLPVKIKSIMKQVDSMDGHCFEYWCAQLLIENGFHQVNVTKESGDQGVDITALNSFNVSYAIQCKCYSSDVGNRSIQEVYAGREVYNCAVSAVITNRYFTPSAQELAHVTGTFLLDRDKVISLIQSARNPNTLYNFSSPSK